MTAKGEITPELPAEAQATWQEADDLLKSGQYERAAELLRTGQVASERAGDAILAYILSVSHQICRAWIQAKVEKDWHRGAHEEAGRREHELEQQLEAIHNLVREYIECPRDEKRKEPPLNRAAELIPPEANFPEPVQRVSPWQRIQSLLGRGPTPRSSGLSRSPPKAPAALPPENAEERDQPSLSVYCLGAFRTFLDENMINNWSSGKGKSIFKYIVAKRGRPVAKDILMDVFWRNADPEAARNNLNVTIYGLRQAFRVVRPDFSYILFQEDHYLLNPAMEVWVDLEHFVLHYNAGQYLDRKGKTAEALREYEIAETLYQGDFLEEDLYEDWPMLQRESLQNNYLLILDRLSRNYLEEKRYTSCIQLCHKILAKDNCREDIHRRLMGCYSQQGQRNLALRQYNLCVETLKKELDVSPSQETRTFCDQIRKGQLR